MSQNTQSDKTEQDQTKRQQRRKVENIEEIKESEKTLLNRAYSIWALVKTPKMHTEQYDQILRQASTFSTVEDFWAQYSHFKRPSLMSFGTFVYIFAEGIKPMWEDEQCKDGGRWSLRVPKTHTNKYWEDLTLALIGEQFTNEGEVCGLALSLKPVNDIISVWIKSGKDQEKIDSIKADIERVIMLDENTMRLEYENFQEVLSRPPPEKKETFNRNYQKNTGGDQEHTGNEDNKGFERRIADNGGGFQRGRGRGRGGRGGLNQ